MGAMAEEARRVVRGMALREGQQRLLVGCVCFALVVGAVAASYATW